MPIVTIGGSSVLTPTRHHGRKVVRAYDVLFGAEFGATASWRFRPRNTNGYAIYPTIREMEGDIAAAWSEAADKTVAEFGNE